MAVSYDPLPREEADATIALLDKRRMLKRMLLEIDRHDCQTPGRGTVECALSG